MAFSFTVPTANTRFQVGQVVEFEGTTDDGVSRLEMVADDQFPLSPVTLRERRWFVAHRFNTSGSRKITCRCFDQDNHEITHLDLTIVIAPPAGEEPTNFGELVPIPRNINPGVTKARHATMIRVFGRPGALSEDCSPVTNTKLRNLLITRDVGPFNVTGLEPAVAALQRIFTKVAQHEPVLLEQVTTAGMLCCRRIRRRPGQPPSRQFSNHSWGTAIDLKIRGALDPRGDGRTQLGLLRLAPFFNGERFFWGAGFSGSSEDSMHFEASNELVVDWDQAGIV